MRGWIYFTRHGEGGPIKVGRTDNPHRRVVDLGVGTPVQLILLGAMFSEQTALEESELHERLAAHRVKGEWFEANAVFKEMDRLGSRICLPDQVEVKQLEQPWSRSINLNIRVTPEQAVLWRATAHSQNKSLSEWMRDVLDSGLGDTA